MDLICLTVIASLLIGLFGMNRKFGFWGYFFCSLALTPFIAIIVLLASPHRKSARAD